MSVEDNKEKYEILFLANEDSSLTALNYESFEYGLSKSTVDPNDYNLVKFNSGYEVLEVKADVINLLNNPKYLDLIQKNKLSIIVFTSNQLIATISALNELNINHEDNCLIISSSSLTNLPPGQNISMSYSNNSEVKSLIVHQELKKIKYTILVYEKGNNYSEDYRRQFESENFNREVIYIPAELNDLDSSIDLINEILDYSNCIKLKDIEIIICMFSTESEYIIPKINYYDNYIITCSESNETLRLKDANDKIPTSVTLLLPLDITESLMNYKKYLLKYDIRPSTFATGYFDCACQMGQMIKLNRKLNVEEFTNRITTFYNYTSAQYGAGWIDIVERRNTNSNYGYIFTYDPIINTEEKINSYYRRSPWFSVLHNSAAMPYYVSNVFWVTPNNFIIYYNEWRYFEQIDDKEELKYYLSFDNGNNIADKNGGKIDISGYASALLPVYYKTDGEIKRPSVTVPDYHKEIFDYPFSFVSKITV